MASPVLLTPQLIPGQRLTRDEFLRRWDAMPDLKRAELIDGIVYMSSPVSIPHRSYDFVAGAWLGQYVKKTPGCQGGTNGTWLMLESAPQPDLDLIILPEYGGQSRTEGMYNSGAPELVVEVSVSTSSYDRGAKLALYQRAGVREYITLVIDPGEVAWRQLVDGQYRMLAPGADGILRSRVFPGLWLEPHALLSRDLARIGEVLDNGLASPEHAEFVEILAQRRGGSIR